MACDRLLLGGRAATEAVRGLDVAMQQAHALRGRIEGLAREENPASRQRKP